MKQARILVVDDERSIGELFVHALGKKDWAVVPVQKARHALDLLQAEHWDLVITDAQMEEMDGFELIQQMTDLGITLPVIVMTGRESDQLIESLLTSNCYGYISKPPNWSYLIKLIEKALKSSVRMQQRPGTVAKESEQD
ncbi:MAG: response regulator [Planctomycetota bacterium]|jgi:two-component system response regulator HydG